MTIGFEISAAAPSDTVILHRVLRGLDRAEELLGSEEFDPDVLLVSTPERLIAHLRGIAAAKPE